VLKTIDDCCSGLLIVIELNEDAEDTIRVLNHPQQEKKK